MHILLCTDGTAQSKPALALGYRLAGLLQARVPVQVTVLGASERPERSAALSQEIAAVQAALETAGIGCSTLIRTAVPRRAIVAQATQERYDLIVVGLLMRGSWLRRWLRGSSVRRILRDVSTPVLVVPFERPQLRRILLCSGDLWYPAETIRLVGEIALASAAEVTLLYVVPRPPLHYPILRELEDAWGALLQTDTPQGRNLKAGRDALRSQGIETGIRIRHGDVARQIMMEIRSGEYDLVALGSTYASQGLYRYFVTSITDFVVERSGRPVLVVRHR